MTSDATSESIFHHFRLITRHKRWLLAATTLSAASAVGAAAAAGATASGSGGTAVQLQTVSNSQLSSAGISLTAPSTNSSSSAATVDSGASASISAAEAEATVESQYPGTVADVKRAQMSDTHFSPPISNRSVYVVEMHLPPGFSFYAGGPASAGSTQSSSGQTTGTTPIKNYEVVFVDATTGSILFGLEGGNVPPAGSGR